MGANGVIILRTAPSPLLPRPIRGRGDTLRNLSSSPPASQFAPFLHLSLHISAGLKVLHCRNHENSNNLARSYPVDRHLHKHEPPRAKTSKLPFFLSLSFLLLTFHLSCQFSPQIASSRSFYKHSFKSTQNVRSFLLFLIPRVPPRRSRLDPPNR